MARLTFAKLGNLPIRFQAVKGVSALDFGYHILSLLAANVVNHFSAATLAGKLGYYHPFMIFGSIALTIGTGLITTLTSRSSVAMWVLFQILAGIGAGSGGQLPLIAVQDALAEEDVPVRYAVVLSSGYLGPTTALAIAQVVFGSVLPSRLKQGIPDVDPDVVKHTGTTDWRQSVSMEKVSGVLEVYNHALTQSWYVAVTLACVSLVSLLGLKWRKLGRKDKVVNTDDEQCKDRLENVEIEAKI